VPATGSVGVPVLITFAAVDPQGQPVAWDMWASGSGGSSGWCCFTGSGVNITFNSPGVYRIGAQAIDRELLISTNYTAIISIDGATGVPPIALATIDTESGAAPLTVNVNMSGSSDPDGVITHYYIGCGGGFTPASTQPTGSCTLTEPGTYWLLLQARDNNGLMGLTSKYVVVTPDIGPPPPPPDDTTGPSVAITSPGAGANLIGTVNLQASASDNPGGSGVQEVEYFLDAITPGASLGKSSAAPYTVSWDVSGVTPGNHTIYAIARDNQGNLSSPATVTVNVNVAFPQVTLLTPANGQTVPRKGQVQMTSSVTIGTYPLSPNRVDYLVNGAVACSGTSATGYSCNWKAPAAVKTYTVQARVVDNHGNVGLSAVHTINAR
jgi:hypothetical protein